MARRRKKRTTKRNRSRARSKAEAKTAPSLRMKPEIENVPETPDAHTMPSSKNMEARVRMAARFRTQAKSIRNYLIGVDHQEDYPGLGHVYDLRHHYIANLIEIAEEELKDCPDFGDLPTLPEGDYVAGLTGLAEHCEHGAEMLEASQTIH